MIEQSHSATATTRTSLRIMHVTGTYLPWTLGGKENYAHSLACELTKLGCNNHIVFNQNENTQEPLGMHELDGIPVEVLPAIEERERRVFYANRTSEVPGFEEALARYQPNIVHMHDFGRNTNLLHLELAQKAGARTVMTYHSPGQSCLQREMLFGGKTVCDGEIQLDRCTECRLAVQGIPAWLRKPVSRISLPVASTGGRLSRALTAREMTAAFAKAWRELIDRLDAIHVQARWIVEVMKINRVPERKIAFFRSGLPIIPQGKFSPSERQPGSPLKITMLGRCEAIKGQEVLIDAVQSLPANTKVEVTFLGPYWNSTDYGQRCLSKIAGDSRFHKPRRVAPQAIAGELAQADALVVPSIWLETGPLVVLEAFAVGLPVIGSNRGGIAELITHEKNGWLFPTGDSQALAHLLQKAFDDPSSLEKLRRQITPPRLMADTAADTKKLYESLVSCQ